MAPKFDPNKPSKFVGRLDTSSISDPAQAVDTLGKAAEAIDIPGSIARAGVYGALSDDSTAMDEMGAQIDRLKRGSEGVKEGPTGADILGAAGVEDPDIQKYGGMAAEMVIDPLQAIPVGKITKPISRAIKNKSAKSASRVLSQYTSVSDFTRKNVDPAVMSQALIDEDLMKHINKPQDLLEAIAGKSKIESSYALSTGERALKKTRQDRGLIREIADDLGQHIDDISSFSKDIKIKNIANPVTYNYTDRLMDPVSGEPFEPKAIRAAEDYVRSIIGKGAEKRDMSLKELYNLKKNLGRNISSKEFWKAPDEAQTVKKELMVDIIRQIDEVLERELKGNSIEIDGAVHDAADYYKVQNGRMSQLINLKGILNSVPLKELKSIDLKQIIGESALAGYDNWCWYRLS